MIKFGIDKVRNHKCDMYWIPKQWAVHFDQCFNDTTTVVYVAEYHIIKTLDPFILLITLAFDVKHIEFYFVHPELCPKNTRGTV